MADEKNEKSSAEKAVEKDPEKVADKGNQAVQETADKEADAGFRGTEVDTTPNENYTVEGVTSGAPVPESSSDPALARRRAAADLAARDAEFDEKNSDKSDK